LTADIGIQDGSRRTLPAAAFFRRLHQRSANASSPLRLFDHQCTDNEPGCPKITLNLPAGVRAWRLDSRVDEATTRPPSSATRNTTFDS
jgi:hypothetical protein